MTDRLLPASRNRGGRAGLQAFVLSLASVSCGGSHSKGVEATDPAAVYQALFAELTRRGDYARKLVLQSTTTKAQDESTPERWATFKDELPSLRHDTYLAFWLANEKVLQLDALQLGQTRFVARARLVEVTHKYRSYVSRVDALVRIFPRAHVVSVSGLGVSGDGGQALVYVHDYVASSGQYYCMRLVDREWVVDGSFVSWQE